MSKFKIITRIKEDDEIISGTVSFENLDKLDFEDLDILINILFKTIVNKKNDIDLQGLDIFYTHDCGHEDLILCVNSIGVLKNIHCGIESAYLRNDNIDKKLFNKDRNNYLKYVEERLQNYDLDDEFKLEFKKI
jgi:hypothetical protein